MRDIAVVMPTVDRSPGPNYLEATLANMERAGVFVSDRLHSFHVVDSGNVVEGHETPWPDRGIVGLAYTDAQTDDFAVIRVRRAGARRSGKRNCAAALDAGAQSGALWVLHVEDDLDVCADFLGGVGRWLDAHARPDVPVYPFSGDHAMIAATVKRGGDAWTYAVENFWGMQCFACRPHTASSLANWFRGHPWYRHADGRLDENAHDLEMHHWATHYGVRTFLGSAPSFVQHIGEVSSICGDTGGRHVFFPSWPGRDWSYRSSS